MQTNTATKSKPATRARKAKNPIWWEEPLDNFVEKLQELHKQHGPYFSRAEMEEVYKEIYAYAFQRGNLWEEQIKLGISAEYLNYLADDLVGYLNHVYQFLKEDVLDRRMVTRLKEPRQKSVTGHRIPNRRAMLQQQVAMRA